MPDDILTLTPPPADKRAAYGSDPNQFVDLRYPPQKADHRKGVAPYPAVINIHGGFWRARYGLEHAGHFCASLTAKGFVTANVEYRRVGNEGGGWPGTFADIRSAYGFLLQNASAYGIDPQRVVVAGHSAGGQLALCLAAHEAGITRVVSLAGVVNLERAYQLHLSDDAVVEFLRGTPLEVPDHYREADPMQLSLSYARQVLIHGSDDDVVPPVFSRDYVAFKRKRVGREKEDASLLEIPGAGHFDLIDPRSVAGERVEETILRLAT